MEEGKHRESVIDAWFLTFWNLGHFSHVEDLATMMPRVCINIPSFESFHKRGLFRGITIHTGVGSRCSYPTWRASPKASERGASNNGLHVFFMCTHQCFAHARVLLKMYHVWTGAIRHFNSVSMALCTWYKNIAKIFRQTCQVKPSGNLCCFYA